MDKKIKKMSAREYDFNKFEYIEQGKERASYIEEKYRLERWADNTIIVFSGFWMLLCLFYNLPFHLIMFTVVVWGSLMSNQISVEAHTLEIEKLDKKDRSHENIITDFLKKFNRWHRILFAWTMLWTVFCIIFLK